LADSGNWHTATNLFYLQRETYFAIGLKAASLFQLQLIGFPLSVICSGHPIEIDKPHILALVAETSFLPFKEQVPFNFKNKIYQQFNVKKDLLIDKTYETPVSFCWTGPLTWFCLGCLQNLAFRGIQNFIRK
jgi:hypothetical protein